MWSLSEAFDDFPDAVGVIEAARSDDGSLDDFVVTYVNRALVEIVGVPPERLVGHRLLEIVPQFATNGAADAYRRVIATGEAWQRELPFDGEVAGQPISALFEMRAVRLGDGALCTYRDITAMRMAEDTTARMAAILESTDDAVVGADPNGKITHWNPGAERLIGWKREEVVGRDVRVLVREEDYAVQQERYLACLAGQRVERIETQWVRRDRSLINVMLTASPIQDRDGTVVGVSAVVHDVTARLRTEDELRRSNAELERFADVAAHDLREPLITIQHLTRLLEATDAADEERRTQMLGHLRSAAVHGNRLVDGLLEYARVGRSAPTFGAVALGPLVAEVLGVLTAQLDEAHANVEVGPMPAVTGDARELSRVLQNLVLNAVKFHGMEPPEVLIDAERDDRGWTISVRDNGVGVRPGNRERIFEIFARGQAQELVPGTGLGLAVCKKIVERHGGRIWVEPREPGGSAFRFTLPDLVAP